MLDKSIKLWDPESGMEEVQHIFCLADQLIKRWKMDWNGMHGESFQQSYFDQQMRTLLWHFLQIAGIGFSYVAFEKVNFDDNEKNTLFTIKKYGSIFLVSILWFHHSGTPQYFFLSSQPSVHISFNDISFF